MFVIVFKMVTMIIFIYIYIMDSSYILMDKYLIERERGRPPFPFFSGFDVVFPTSKSARNGKSEDGSIIGVPCETQGRLLQTDDASARCGPVGCGKV